MTTQRDAYNLGKDTGYDIASENAADYNLVDEDEREKFVSDMMETEADNFRQYSPFEFTAKEFNESLNPDAVWDAYDKGVYRGVCILVKEQRALLKNTHE
jgi:hypothetical protein